MSFVSYPCLILQISGQTLQGTVARENFWQLNGLLVLSISTYFFKKERIFQTCIKERDGQAAYASTATTCSLVSIK